MFVQKIETERRGLCPTRTLEQEYQPALSKKGGHRDLIEREDANRNEEEKNKVRPPFYALGSLKGPYFAKVMMQ